MISLVLFAALFFAVVLFAALLLWRAARRRALVQIGFFRCFLAALLTALACLALHFLAKEYRKPIIIELVALSTWTNYEIAPLALLAGEILAGVLVCWLVTVFLFRTSLWSGLRLWLFAWPVLGVTLVALHYAVPKIVEAKQLTSNSMCPTLLGRTQIATCPECGGLAYTPWITDRRGVDLELGQVCVCTACCHQFREFEPGAEVLEPDWFLVNKLLSPRRWDLVLFRPMHLGDSPSSPRICYVKRVLGMPGEEVIIKDGGVWINGERMMPPDEIAGLQFLDISEGEEPIQWGSAAKPAKLGADEFFVVGDYSYRSNDSCLWPPILEGRPSFALPAARIEGVVDVRYSPFTRWYVFR